MDNILTSNVYLNSLKINCFQSVRLDTEVEAGEIYVLYDKNRDFSNHIQSYTYDTDFVGTNEKTLIFF